MRASHKCHLHTHCVNWHHLSTNSTIFLEMNFTRKHIVSVGYVGCVREVHGAPFDTPHLLTFFNQFMFIHRRLHGAWGYTAGQHWRWIVVWGYSYILDLVNCSCSVWTLDFLFSSVICYVIVLAVSCVCVHCMHVKIGYDNKKICR